MSTDSIEISFLSIFALITFFIFLIVSKYSFKIKKGILLDKDFSKPQSFHSFAVSRSGGIACLISLNLFIGMYYLLYSKILYEYIFISLLMFFVGFLDDIKTKIRPALRLSLMIFFLTFLIYFLPIKIFNIDIPILTTFLGNKFFTLVFVLFCFLFIINGANLIDGFNGLLTIHLIIINLILTLININNGYFEFSTLLIAQIIILISFLLFNFPKAKIFLGDGGSYLLGSLVALNTVITNNLNSNTSSFFYCTLLFYLFFEVFFSFFRKIFQKKSPIYPDNKHLHMLSYQKITPLFGKDKGNYLNSLTINFVYFVLILPGLYFLDNPIISRYWFFTLIIIYLLFYLRLYRLTKN